jgi:hypothetical protein
MGFELPIGAFTAALRHLEDCSYANDAMVMSFVNAASGDLE